MIVRIHGFDWEAYTKWVMPAFAHWLIEGDEAGVSQLYQQTRAAREEQFIPAALRQACDWPRAQAFVRQLARSTHTRHEYQTLCASEEFTPLSDRYIHRYPPQLYQNSDALRAIWGALVEEYCQAWFTLPAQTVPADQDRTQIRDESTQPPAQSMSRGEIVSLLNAAGLHTLAQEVSELARVNENVDEEVGDEDFDEEDEVKPLGVAIGQHPCTLQVRGWLATISVRAMALFELLACGRRYMPFGTRVGELNETYIGYLTPDELQQLAACLRGVQPPTHSEAEADYARFRQQQQVQGREMRLLDEVLPHHADAFLTAVRLAAQCGLGLICSVG